MSVSQITDKTTITKQLEDDPIVTLEALDENILGMDGLVTVFAPDGEDPPAQLVVRWGQKSLGLGSYAMLRARRMTELAEVIEAFPAESGELDMVLPFWASGAVAAQLKAQPLGAEAWYELKKDWLVTSPVVKQCIRLDDPHVIKPMFPKLADDTPAYVLSLNQQLTAVAAVTHCARDIARVFVYVVEEARGRGFGRGVLTALAEELLALRLTPTLRVSLSDEPAVRLAEGSGFRLYHAMLRLAVNGRHVEPGPGLVGLGSRSSS
ncbi:MAG: GNAT family N-acetyltransferase [Deltaproteobacteria bacterium]